MGWFGRVFQSLQISHLLSFPDPVCGLSTEPRGPEDPDYAREVGGLEPVRKRFKESIKKGSTQ